MFRGPHQLQGDDGAEDGGAVHGPADLVLPQPAGHVARAVLGANGEPSPDGVR